MNSTWLEFEATYEWNVGSGLSLPHFADPAAGDSGDTASGPLAPPLAKWGGLGEAVSTIVSCLGRHWVDARGFAARVGPTLHPTNFPGES